MDGCRARALVPSKACKPVQRNEVLPHAFSRGWHATHARDADLLSGPSSLRSVRVPRQAAAGVRAARAARGRFCPTLQELRVVQKQRVKARRAKLYYLRDRKPSEFKV